MAIIKVLLKSALLVFLLTLCPLAQADNQAVSIKIGFVGPLSGIASTYGMSAKNGIELAQQELGADSKLSFSFEDDQFAPAKTVAAYKKLTKLDHVQLVISIASTLSNAIAPLAQNDRVPLLAWASDPKVALGRNFVIRTFPSGQAEGKTIASEALSNSY